MERWDGGLETARSRPPSPRPLVPNQIRRMSNQDYTVGQLMALDACTNCQACVEVCPAVAAASDGELSGLYRMKGLKEVLKGRAGLFRRLFKKQAPEKKDLDHFSDTVFRCTLCGNCQEVCPVGIRLKELWVSLRQDLVHSDAFPKKINMIRANLEKSRNVFAEDNEERADWVEDMSDAPDHGFVKDRAEVVYFTGCVAAYFPLAQKIPIALAEILDAAEVDFTLMGEDEWCCGFPMLGAGLRDMFGEFMSHNLEAVRQRGAKQVIFACPSCFQMWREHYPRGVPIAHASQFLMNLVLNGRVPMKELPMTVTYHDPCDLGRGARVFDAPRDVIRSIPGVKLVELPQNRENCQCCGGGGNLEMIDAGLSAAIAKRKIEQVISTGADAVVTSCQQCVRTMTTYVKRNKVPVDVLDITQLVRKALDR
jgi:heterodisulfide reductase subunit D